MKRGNLPAPGDPLSASAPGQDWAIHVLCIQTRKIGALCRARSQKTVVSLLFECWTCWMSQAKAKQGILRRYDEVVQLASNWVLSIYQIRRTCMQRQQYFFHIRVWSKVLWLTEETHQNWSSKGIRENGEQTTLWLFKKKLHMVAMLKNLSLIKEDVLSQ